MRAITGEHKDYSPEARFTFLKNQYLFCLLKSPPRRYLFTGKSCRMFTFFAE